MNDYIFTKNGLMAFRTIQFTLLLGFLLLSCKTDSKNTPNKEDTNISKTDGKTIKSKADELIAATIDKHGGKKYDQAYYGFTFRKKKYTFKNDGPRFIYTMEEEKDGNTTTDSLTNNGLVRYIGSRKTQLSDKDIFKYTEALNSVIYFATLPSKLKDSAVKSTYLGATTIKNEPYEMVQVTFEQQGGGVDFEDVFLYWIHSKKKTMDYLAYEYHTNDGGVRFRSAYNTRDVDGIIFQDYINYKAPLKTPLKELPSIYEKGQLTELSKIETEEVVNLGS
ncbi:DUF6503 family protein [Euzebyella saccharophila]|uniref:DUF6503 family protein n=1 Tax=Euzebyella saccharophila TaxID=679664 RepID=A0ABV8JM19_9FLAO|nr:DUF6503 family protein [Euzebyella saccharophila]